MVDAREITVKEFDYQAEIAVVYQENGVTIRSIPAVSCLLYWRR